ncbi:class I SAM-dependent methyltransferase [Lactococcus cremoris]|uniref:Class I SAM-dependent methyltransferase n=1 Tax=Lactococcus lactis subsp. cremoris TaxID=1359 RepID=A0AAX4AKA7_LACLC|nr:class I SAM-dependent methyltransferase [Lactococcus cremoris]KGH33402.1 DNA methyltransferase [Lactococcus cremoris]QSE63694.1 class I SAM-dependent methyltransferase [Lactococcus cremoris]WMX71568.1 class I SAM-dependent methyltransferase [Lactococcus cremoris]
MNMEKVAQGFELVVENITKLSGKLDTDFYDAFVEQNAAFLDGTDQGIVELSVNNDKLRQLNLSNKEWQKLFQFVLLKGSQVAPLQANHAMTPDAIGLIFNFIIEHLNKNSELRLIEFGSGMGNLAETLLVNLNKKVDYVGFEVDDLLLDLSASMAEIMGSHAEFMQIDAVQKRLMEPADVVVSDLPIGFYPDDEVAKNFEVAAADGHTFAHHLLIEQSFNYLKDGAFAVFLAPEDLLTSVQGPLLKEWISKHGSIMAVITLPSSLFNADAKAIYVLKKGSAAHATFAHPLSSLTDRESLEIFMEEFTKTVKL